MKIWRLKKLVISVKELQNIPACDVKTYLVQYVLQKRQRQKRRVTTIKPQHQVRRCRDCQTKTKALGGKLLDKEESPIGPAANKRKQWTREQKLEFIALYKKYNNKSRAARELQI